MKNQLPDDLRERVLILAPTGRDSRAACELLQKAGLSCKPCCGIEDLQSKLTAGAGVAIIAEEAFVATDPMPLLTGCAPSRLGRISRSLF